MRKYCARIFAFVLMTGWLMFTMAGPALAAGPQDSDTGTMPAMIAPGTPAAARALQQLDHAAYVDRRNAHGWTAEDSQVGQFYYGKADQAKGLAERLRAGNSISSDELKKALDVHGASQVGGY